MIRASSFQQSQQQEEHLPVKHARGEKWREVPPALLSGSDCGSSVVARDVTCDGHADYGFRSGHGGAFSRILDEHLYYCCGVRDPVTRFDCDYGGAFPDNVCPCFGSDFGCDCLGQTSLALGRLCLSYRSLQQGRFRRTFERWKLKIHTSRWNSKGRPDSTTEIHVKKK